MVTGVMMEAVMNLKDVSVVRYFLSKQQTHADNLWQEYVDE